MRNLFLRGNNIVSREFPLLRATYPYLEGFTYIKMQLPLIMETTIMWEERVEKRLFSFPGQKIKLRIIQ